MTSDRRLAGDVVWAPDPYRTGSNLPATIALTESDWVAGSNPDKLSYCSPWVLATIKHDAVAHPQGQVTEEFTRRIVSRSGEYPSGEIETEH